MVKFIKGPVPNDKVSGLVAEITDLAMSWGARTKTEEELQKERDEKALLCKSVHTRKHCRSPPSNICFLMALFSAALNRELEQLKAQFLSTRQRKLVLPKFQALLFQQLKTRCGSVCLLLLYPSLC